MASYVATRNFFVDSLDIRVKEGQVFDYENSILTIDARSYEAPVMIVAIHAGWAEPLTEDEEELALLAKSQSSLWDFLAEDVDFL